MRSDFSVTQMQLVHSRRGQLRLPLDEGATFVGEQTLLVGEYNSEYSRTGFRTMVLFCSDRDVDEELALQLQAAVDQR
jgi:hypothetical protein